MSSDDVGGRPLGTASYFLSEALRRLWISRRNSLAAIGMIATALTILGTFMLISQNLGRAVERQTGATQLVVYFDPDATESEIESVEGFLESRPMLRNPRFISQDEASEVFRETFPNLRGVVEDLDQNPFPASFEVDVPENRIDTREFFDAMSELRQLEGVEELQYNWEWIASLRNLVRIVRMTGLIVGGILAIASAFMIANVIRLTMILYREEIGIMRLVGATESMVRVPFLVEGLIQGVLGGLVAVATLALLYYGGLRAMDTGDALLLNSLFVGFLELRSLVLIVTGGAAAGLLGAWIAVRDNAEEKFEEQKP
ncbi:MAG: permease-like cell division protein FtsX [Thermoanaerobaculia bacterium]|nr:permease-like cell division protein FtsX [Thermoanaerobaculia bacterium]